MLHFENHLGPPFGAAVAPARFIHEAIEERRGEVVFPDRIAAVGQNQKMISDLLAQFLKETHPRFWFFAQIVVEDAVQAQALKRDRLADYLSSVFRVVPVHTMSPRPELLPLPSVAKPPGMIVRQPNVGPFVKPHFAQDNYTWIQLSDSLDAFPSDRDGFRGEPVRQTRGLAVILQPERARSDQHEVMARHCLIGVVATDRRLESTCLA